MKIRGGLRRVPSDRVKDAAYMVGAAKESRVPLALLLVGLVIYAAAAVLSFRSSGPAPVLLFFGLNVIAGVGLTLLAMYAVAAAADISFGELRTAMLKLAAIYVFSTSLGQLLPWWAGALVAWAVAFSLFIWFFELEIAYIFALDVVMSLIWLAVHLVFTPALVSRATP